jgi:hypothetical protein
MKLTNLSKRIGSENEVLKNFKDIYIKLMIGETKTNKNSCFPSKAKQFRKKDFRWF